MKSKRVRRGLVAFAVVFFLIGIGVVSAQEDRGSAARVGEQAQSTVVTLDLTSKQQTAAETLWTRDNMLKAQTLALPVVKEDQAPAQKDPGLSTEPGTAVPGTAPDTKMNELARKLYPQEWTLAETAVAEGKSPDQTTIGPATASTAVFDRYAVNYFGQTWQTFPYRTMGRLFFTTPGGQRSSCTASVVANRGVVTAGHCVYTPGQGWHRNLAFVPAYRYGAAPYGVFIVTRASTLSNWIYYGMRDDDVGMVTVADRSGYTVSQWVGSLGLAWNWSYVQLLHAFGYPGNVGGGNYSSVCVGETWAQKVGGIIGMGCDMTYGASGGPWVLRFAPYTSGSVNYVNSVVSGGDPTIPKFYGPYFDANNIALLWNWVRNL